MDLVSASFCNLNQDERPKLSASNFSLARYERTNFQNLWPQILAALISTSFHISIGMTMTFSAILLPQLAANPEFEISKSEASLVASIIALTTPIGSLIVGILMDHFGRLNSLNLAAVPGVSGCVLIALSHNSSMLIAGRALVGLAQSMGSSPAAVYLTEIARKDMRGSLISIGAALTSSGMVLSYLLGWFLNWRQVAWIATGFNAIPCVLIALLPESPVWLLSKNRTDEARKSLNWLYKHQPEVGGRSFAEAQLSVLQEEQERKQNEEKRKKKENYFFEFLKPTGYKPLFVLSGLFLFQQFSGVYVFFFYSITFFQEVGSKWNPYLASVYIGVLRFVMSMACTYLQGAFGRRPLMLISCLSMAVCIFLSGLTTFLLKKGAITFTFLPGILLLMFVATSMIGVITIPYPMTAELFPLKIRGVAHSVAICIASFLMFLSLQLYPTLNEFFGGICGLQYFFTGVCLANALFVYVFLPETHQKKLSEIEEYFRRKLVFLGKKHNEHLLTTT